jgi:hypothetical protein
MLSSSTTILAAAATRTSLSPYRALPPNGQCRHGGVIGAMHEAAELNDRNDDPVQEEHQTSGDVAKPTRMDRDRRASGHG